MVFALSTFGLMMAMAFLASRRSPDLAFILALIAIGAGVYRFRKTMATQYPVESVWTQPVSQPEAKKSIKMSGVITPTPTTFIPPPHVVTLPNGRYIDAQTGKRWTPPSVRTPNPSPARTVVIR